MSNLLSLYKPLNSIKMKKSILVTSWISILLFTASCSKTESSSSGVSGDPSPMAQIGETVSSSSSTISGVSDFNATVTNYQDGISTYNASLIVTNALIRNMMATYPGISVSGNKVTATNFKIQQTKNGIKCITGGGEGVIVNYNSNVGDTYAVGTTGKTRKVVRKSTTDDYPYGFYNIKAIQVEANANTFINTGGVKSFTYIANHKFGLVGVKISFDDGTSALFPIYSSSTN
jgi:hypothetical protein